VKRVAVVGAGMAGLGAARELQAAGVEVVVFEREPEIGGRARTAEIDGVPVDVGAQFIAAFCTEALAAARAAGIGEALRPRPQRSAIAAGGAAHPLRRGRDLLTGDLLSLRSRLHLFGLAIPLVAAIPLLDPYRLAEAARLDRRSADALVRRWAGGEAAELFVDPLLRGLLYWDPATTSAAVLLAMLGAGARHGTRAFRVVGGMQRLPEALAAGLDVRAAEAVIRVEPGRGGVAVATETGSLSVDGVVCATTASAAAAIVCGLEDDAAAFLRSISYSRTLVATYRHGAPRADGSLIYPTATAPDIASVDPAQGGLVRVFLSDLGYERLAPEAILDAVRAAGVATGWTDGAVLRHTLRWPEGLPRFPPGALRRRHLQHPEALHRGPVAFAGDYLFAPHVEGAMRSGRAAARTVLRRLAG
jgi:protoporphyrinogen/coproporphyrinogen III oxidase